MPRLRLLTFNIAHARGLSFHQGLRTVKQLCTNLVKIAKLIQRLEVDIVALQEIDENSRWSGSFDHLAFLREHTGLPYSAFGINNRRTGRYHLNYGNAVLSRFPIVHAETIPFGAGKIGEKGFIFVEIDLGKRKRLPLFNIHMHHSSRPQRLKQVIRLMHYLDEQKLHRASLWGAGPVVCGDFNNPSNSPDATSTLLGYFEQSNNYTLLPKTGRTFPSPFPARALDYVFLPDQCQQPKAEIVRCMLSDHRPVLVEFALPH